MIISENRIPSYDEFCALMSRTDAPLLCAIFDREMMR